MASYPNYYQNSPYMQSFSQAPVMQPTQPITPVQSVQQPAFACRPVTSREEAVAAQTDYFSAGLLMPDLGHGLIFMKRFNPNTGASDFFEFAIKTEQPQTAPEYVTRSEFEELKASINRRTVKVKKEAAEDE